VEAGSHLWRSGGKISLDVGQREEAIADNPERITGCWRGHEVVAGLAP
jgi:hypothetical protein